MNFSQSVFSSCDFIAGWVSGIFGLIVGHPLDTIKVRQQTLGKVSLYRIIGSTFIHEGVYGFYKGLLFPVLTAGCLNSVFFGVYGNLLRFIGETRKQSELQYIGTRPYEKWHWDVFYAGCGAGFVAMFVACPTDLIKIQLQTQVGDKSLKFVARHKKTYIGPWDCLFDMYKSQGIRGFYRGFTPMLYRDIVASGIYMSVYAHGLEQTIQTKPVLSIMAAGGVAGVLSWAVVVPFDVIKSRIQADSKSSPVYKGMIDCILQTYRKEGITVFFRGFWMIAFRAFPVNAATFLGYEIVISFCQNKQSTKRAV